MVPAALVHPLPADRPVAPAALLEPAGCVASGLLELGVPRAGSRVAVVGDGPIGLLAVLLIRLSSPRELVLVGRRKDRLRHGAACGATAVVDGDGAPADLHGSFDLVIEATNSPLGRLPPCAWPGAAVACCCSASPGAGRAEVDPGPDHPGPTAGAGGVRRLAGRLAVDGLAYGSGQFDPAPLITHRYPLAEAETALAVSLTRPPAR